MENKNIIVVLLAIIVVLAVALGAMFLHANAKEPTHMKVIQTDENDDNLFMVQVLDSNDDLITDGTINVTIIADNGSIVYTSEDAPLMYGEEGTFDFDLEKGKYTINATYSGHDKYDKSFIESKLNISKVTPTYTVEEIIAMDYPQESSIFGHYKVTQRQDELALIETSSGKSFVLAGDGYYTFDGYDSQGNIKLGSYVGKY